MQHSSSGRSVARRWSDPPLPRMPERNEEAMAIDRIKRRVVSDTSSSPAMSVVRSIAAVMLALIAILVVLPAALAASAAV